MSRRTAVAAANWKMNLTRSDVGPYADAYRERAPRPGAGLEVVVYPPAPLLGLVAERLGDVAEVGAQTCHWKPAGAYTGEISVPMIVAEGARHVLVGHSERRQLAGETDEVCQRKLAAALAGGLEPTLCVGETLEEREAGRQRAVVLQQLARAAEGLDRGHFERLRIAYEPVWAIGTGRTASPDDAQRMHAEIRAALSTIATSDLADGIPILYGGSVKPDNVEELVGRPDVDGVLVGGASLEPESFAAIARATAARVGHGDGA